jgi:hypothetical protein
MAEDAKVVQLKVSARPKPDLPELGSPGTQFFHGFIVSDEYVPELIGRAGLDTFDKMRRSDGMSAATLRGIKLPLLSAAWAVTPASEDTRDVEIAKSVEENLFDGMSLTWQDHLRQVLSYLDFGFYVGEMVWAIDDATDTVKLRKIAPRLQRTIYRWNMQDDGGLDTVTQFRFSADGSFIPVDIPADKLVIFVNEKEGANWLGKSVLRSGYKHWFIKDQLYRIQAMAAERHGVGIPVMTLAEGKEDEPNMTRAEDILSGIRAHERGYVVEPNGYTFRIESMKGQPMDMLPMIQHHDRSIAVAVLAQFLTLGEKPEGSNALSKDHSTFFMLAERAVAAYVCDIHNRHVIPRMVDFNYAGVTKYPRLTVGGIDTRDAMTILNALGPAANAGLITWDEGLENALRALADVPARPEGAPPPTPKNPAPIGPGPQPDAPPEPIPMGGEGDAGVTAMRLLRREGAQMKASLEEDLEDLKRRDGKREGQLDELLGSIRELAQRRPPEEPLGAAQLKELAQQQARLIREVRDQDRGWLAERIADLDQRESERQHDVRELSELVRELAQRRPQRVVTEKLFKFGKGPQGHTVISGAREVTRMEDE